MVEVASQPRMKAHTARVHPGHDSEVEELHARIAALEMQLAESRPARSSLRTMGGWCRYFLPGRGWERQYDEADADRPIEEAKCRSPSPTRQASVTGKVADPPKQFPGVIMPSDTWKEAWDLLMLSLVVYSSVVVPFRFCFEVDAEGGEADVDPLEEAEEAGKGFREDDAVHRLR